VNEFQVELTSIPFLPSSLPVPSFFQALTFGLQTGFAIPAIINQTEKYYDVSLVPSELPLNSFGEEEMKLTSSLPFSLPSLSARWLPGIPLLRRSFGLPPSISKPSRSPHRTQESEWKKRPSFNHGSSLGWKTRDLPVPGKLLRNLSPRSSSSVLFTEYSSQASHIFSVSIQLGFWPLVCSEADFAPSLLSSLVSLWSASESTTTPRRKTLDSTRSSSHLSSSLVHGLGRQLGSLLQLCPSTWSTVGPPVFVSPSSASLSFS